MIRLRRWWWAAVCWAVTFTRTGRLDGYARRWQHVDQVDVRIEVAGDAS